jgi:hypothetical protein
MRIQWIVALLVGAIALAMAKPTIYKRNEDNVFEPGGWVSHHFMPTRFNVSASRE